MYTLTLPPWVQSFLRARRRARLRRFLAPLDLPSAPRVVDVGCGSDGRSFSDHVPAAWQIVGVDLGEAHQIRQNHPNFRFVRASACELPFPDQHFDLTVSFGMLEHILGDDYCRAAREMQRVSRSWVVMVPWRWAPIEPHYAFPFFGALSRPTQEWLIRHVLYRERADDYVADHRASFEWRTMAQYKRDFPGSRIVMSPTLDTMAVVGGEHLRR